MLHNKQQALLLCQQINQEFQHNLDHVFVEPNQQPLMLCIRSIRRALTTQPDNSYLIQKINLYLQSLQHLLVTLKTYQTKLTDAAKIELKLAMDSHDVAAQDLSRMRGDIYIFHLLHHPFNKEDDLSSIAALDSTRSDLLTQLAKLKSTSILNHQQKASLLLLCEALEKKVKRKQLNEEQKEHIQLCISELFNILTAYDNCKYNLSQESLSKDKTTHFDKKVEVNEKLERVKSIQDNFIKQVKKFETKAFEWKLGQVITATLLSFAGGLLGAAIGMTLGILGGALVGGVFGNLVGAVSAANVGAVVGLIKGFGVGTQIGIAGATILCSLGPPVLQYKMRTPSFLLSKEQSAIRLFARNLKKETYQQTEALKKEITGASSRHFKPQPVLEREMQNLSQTQYKRVKKTP